MVPLNDGQTLRCAPIAGALHIYLTSGKRWWSIKAAHGRRRVAGGVGKRRKRFESADLRFQIEGARSLTIYLTVSCERWAVSSKEGPYFGLFQGNTGYFGINSDRGGQLKMQNSK